LRDPVMRQHKNSLVLFRLGESLVAGELENAGSSSLHLRLSYVTDGERFREVRPLLLKVHESLKIREIEPPCSVLEGETVAATELLHEGLFPVVYRGRCGRLAIHAYEVRGRGVLISEARGRTWVPLPEAFSVPLLSQAAALEGVRGVFEGLRLVPGGKPVLEHSTALDGPLHVYMKTSPFRDIGRLGEGTDVTIRGYENGCAVLEADGETFWYPVESLLPVKKDDWYYFNLDLDSDGIPDPVQYLPSKVALGRLRPDHENNFNAQEFLPHVSGHFQSDKEIRNDDYGILEDFLGTLGYEDFEREGHPEAHDDQGIPIGMHVVGEPDEEGRILEPFVDLAALGRKDDPGKDAVPDDADGTASTEEEDAVLGETVDLILSGRDVGEALGKLSQRR
jgi:hypothetical protein